MADAVCFLVQAGGLAPALLTSRVWLVRALGDLPGRLGLERIATALVVETASQAAGEAGSLAGVALLAEGHVALRSLPALGVLRVEVSLHRSLVPQTTVVARLCATFGLAEVEVTDLRPGRVQSPSRVA